MLFYTPRLPKVIFKTFQRRIYQATEVSGIPVQLPQVFSRASSILKRLLITLHYITYGCSVET